MKNYYLIPAQGEEREEEALSQSSSNLLETRGDFKLHAARMHLEHLRQMESEFGSLVASEIRIDAEIELDEFFYHLVGVKDALLHEINREFKLHIKSRNVAFDCVCAKLKNKKGLRANVPNILMQDLTKMQFHKKKKGRQHSLGIVVEFNNHSKHRAMIRKYIVMAGRIIVFLRYPNTNGRMKKPVLDYLDDSYKRVEKLQEIVRKKIAKYRI